jgi:hypothetical protein
MTGEGDGRTSRRPRSATRMKGIRGSASVSVSRLLSGDVL